MKTPWINFREMREVSSKQNKYTDWTYQTNIDDEVSLEPPCDGDESNHLLGIREDETRYTEESILVAQLASNQDLQVPTETNGEEGIEHTLNSDEITVEESPLTMHQPVPAKTNDEEEIEKLSVIDENSAEKSSFTEHLPVPIETTIEDEMELSSDSEKTPVEEQDLTVQSDSNGKFFSNAESEVENKTQLDDTADLEKNDSISKSVQGEVRSITKKSPFSTYVEIKDFLHAPICGENTKNTTFEFLNLNDNLTPQFETKLFHTITDYPEYPDCRLVHSNINQMISLMKMDTNDKNNLQHHPFKSVVFPLHNPQSIEKGEINSSSIDHFIHIRVPVVVGEYKIEICLEEFIEFDKGIIGVKEISNKVVLTDCRFVPIHLSKSLGNGTCTALKGNLFIEGYIQQNIEYTFPDTPNESVIYSNHLCQNIVLELIIHMLQIQKIRVLYGSPCSGR
ncbi:BC_2427 family protein [Lysinibacillus fusiformis]|uniref:BC_2427 family protein n=1 Tax=Lysinibacillus fusiformis TaxID=28031 RepID=UPI0021B69DFF|nr:hypothetical protein [Lysinibacillus fusiformis]